MIIILHKPESNQHFTMKFGPSFMFITSFLFNNLWIFSIFCPSFMRQFSVIMAFRFLLLKRTICNGNRIYVQLRTVGSCYDWFQLNGKRVDLPINNFDIHFCRHWCVTNNNCSLTISLYFPFSIGGVNAGEEDKKQIRYFIINW